MVLAGASTQFIQHFFFFFFFFLIFCFLYFLFDLMGKLENIDHQQIRIETRGNKRQDTVASFNLLRA